GLSFQRSPVCACSLVSSLLLSGATMSQQSSLTQSAHSVRQVLTAYSGDLHEAKHHRVGPGDRTRPCRVRSRQRSDRQTGRRRPCSPRQSVPQAIYHTIVCIRALVAHRESDHWAVDALGAPHIGERTEKQLIAAFCDRIAELKPQLITFNGNSFDLPVLRYRAMIHGVSAPGLAARLYFNRYTEDAVDLCDILSSFAPHTKASLNELSKIMGLPGKPEDIDGNEVERYSSRARSRRLPTIARLMSSTPTGSGSGMNYFADD